LRSYYKWTNGPDPTVIYIYSSHAFKEGYDKLKHDFSDVNWIFQNNFKQDLLNSIKNKTFTVFFVDDIVFKSNFDFDYSNILLEDSSVLCLSLRLSPLINYCYALNIPSPPPDFGSNCTWSWQGKRGDWGYPMSADGHIFRTNEILPLLKQLDYRNPNTLESEMAGRPLSNPKMACLDKHPIFNIPHNLVQTEWHNRHYNGLSASDLNDKYLLDKEIDIDYLASIQNNSCHYDVDYKFNTKF